MFIGLSLLLAYGFTVGGVPHAFEREMAPNFRGNHSISAMFVSDQAHEVSSLIVRYRPGTKPGKIGTEPLGASFVTGRAGQWLRVGQYLGFRMWRIDLRYPVSQMTANRIARQMKLDVHLELAEPDSEVFAIQRGSAPLPKGHQ